MFDEDSERDRSKNARPGATLFGSLQEPAGNPSGGATAPSGAPGPNPSSPSSTLPVAGAARSGGRLSAQVEIVRDTQTKAKTYSERLDEIQRALESLGASIDARIEHVRSEAREAGELLNLRIAQVGLAVRDRLDDIYARAAAQDEIVAAVKQSSRESAQIVAAIDQSSNRLRKFLAETTSASDIAFQQFTVAFEEFAKELHEAFTQLDSQVETLALRTAEQSEPAGIDVERLTRPLIALVEQTSTRVKHLEESLERLQVGVRERAFDDRSSMNFGLSMIVFLALVQIALLAWLAMSGY